MLQAQIFIGADHWKGEVPLYEYILQFLVRQKVMGATVYRGRLGFDGKHLSRPNDLFSFDETPMVIAFIDEEEKVKTALTRLRKEMKSGFIVTNHVDLWN
jgi:PII-like signaling protein